MAGRIDGSTAARGGRAGGARCPAGQAGAAVLDLPGVVERVPGDPAGGVAGRPASAGERRAVRRLAEELEHVARAWPRGGAVPRVVAGGSHHGRVGAVGAVHVLDDLRPVPAATARPLAQLLGCGRRRSGRRSPTRPRRARRGARPPAAFVGSRSASATLDGTPNAVLASPSTRSTTSTVEAVRVECLAGGRRDRCVPPCRGEQGVDRQTPRPSRRGTGPASRARTRRPSWAWSRRGPGSREPIMRRSIAPRGRVMSCRVRDAWRPPTLSGEPCTDDRRPAVTAASPALRDDRRGAAPAATYWRLSAERWGAVAAVALAEALAAAPGRPDARPAGDGEGAAARRGGSIAGVRACSPGRSPWRSSGIVAERSSSSRTRSSGARGGHDPRRGSISAGRRGRRPVLASTVAAWSPSPPARARRHLVMRPAPGRRVPRPGQFGPRHLRRQGHRGRSARAGADHARSAPRRGVATAALVLVHRSSSTRRSRWCLRGPAVAGADHRDDQTSSAATRRSRAGDLVPESQRAAQPGPAGDAYPRTGRRPAGSAAVGGGAWGADARPAIDPARRRPPAGRSALAAPPEPAAARRTRPGTRAAAERLKPRRDVSGRSPPAAWPRARRALGCPGCRD